MNVAMRLMSSAERTVRPGDSSTAPTSESKESSVSRRSATPARLMESGP